jgi:hypothetical protein
MSLYIVWVGGVADYEGDNLLEAEAIRDEWQAEGYQDVILENTDTGATL